MGSDSVDATVRSIRYIYVEDIDWINEVERHLAGGEFDHMIATVRSEVIDAAVDKIPAYLAPRLRVQLRKQFGINDADQGR